MTLIDTAEMYADGAAEEVVADAIAGRRDDAFVVSKALPQNAGGRRLAAACERSLRRLRIERIDLYLLHWRGSIPLADTVAGMEALRAAGKIAAWGVSNLDAGDMAELAALPGGESCATDQVLYNPDGPRHRVRPAALVRRARHAGDGLLAGRPGREAAARAGAGRRWRAGTVPRRRRWRSPGASCTAASFRSRSRSDPSHVRENAAAAALELTAEDRAAIDRAFPPPARPQPLAML